MTQEKHLSFIESPIDFTKLKIKSFFPWYIIFGIVIEMLNLGFEIGKQFFQGKLSKWKNL